MTTISKPSSTIVIDAAVGVWAVLPNVAETDTLALFAEWLQMGYRIIAPTLWTADKRLVNALQQHHVDWVYNISVGKS